MARDSALSREKQISIPVSGLNMETEGGEGSDKAAGSSASAPSTSASDEISQQILELKQKQELQKQKLWYAFQEQKQQLELQHQLELEQRIKELRDQRIAEEQQIREKQRELQRPISIAAMKEKADCSANASSEVKLKLQNFLMQKKQAANGLSMNNVSAASSYRNWGVIKSSSGESLPNTNASSVHPYKIPQPQSIILKYDSDYPLRKTASEPNLLKIRLKQSVLEKKARIGPFAAKRHERLLTAAQRRLLKHQSQLPNTNTDSSGPNSPPSVTSRTSPSGTIAEENEAQIYEQNSADSRANISDLALFSSPSMPNISLGRSHLINAHNHMNQVALLAASSHHPPYPLDLTGSIPHRPSTLVLAPPPSSILPPPPLACPPMTIYGHPLPITDSQVAQARLYKQGHRPLGRTQSAPLPLGHPMLTGFSPLNPTHYENSEAERQAYEQKMTFKSRLRQSVLGRSESNGTLKEEDSQEAIDLTGKPPESMVTDDGLAAYLHEQRELLFANRMGVCVPTPETDERAIRPLSRTLSTPLVPFSPVNLSLASRFVPPPDISRPTTGLAFDSLMLKHACMCGNNASHPEHSGRLQSIWARLVETGLASRCDRLRSRKASQEELQSVHSETHAILFGASQGSKQKFEPGRATFVRLACGGVGVDLDTTWNEHHTASAARMAVGCVVDLAFKTMKGDVKNGFAVVRPPGHHAEPNAAMGFCFFNSVAIAARLLRQKLPEVKKVLILDWDVHHGNGTQQIFYDDPDILYLSIHRHDNGNFFPGTGGPSECGSGPGLGFNVNIAWSGGLSPPLGDAEYLAAFRTVVLPIAREFSPDIILVSAGFDAAAGHPAPLGGYLVSPACFGHLTRQLTKLANGKVVLALEGGYDLPAICDSAQECVRALLGDEICGINEMELKRAPCLAAVETLQKTVAIQASHWPCLKASAHTIGMSVLEARTSEKDESDAVNAMAGLSMKPQDRTKMLLEEPMEEDEK